MSKLSKGEGASESIPKWSLADLQRHLQSAIDLEFWTIPFYMSAMYSIKDPSSEVYQLVRSVVNEEMLHLELACNVANSYGVKIEFQPPVYQGQNIPHLDFRLDTPNPTRIFCPYSAEIGPLDEERLNAMCLIEYPEWDTEREPNLRPEINNYGSIGEFYDALEIGMIELSDYIRGGKNQKNFFNRFYSNFAEQTVSVDGKQGLKQAINLITAITSQGEGQTEGDTNIPKNYQNTADGIHSSWPHFRKFMSIRNKKDRPETYVGIANPEPGSLGYKAQQILITNFTVFLTTLEQLFNGMPTNDFDAQMFTLGGSILSCWQHNAIPKFSK